MAGRGRNNPLQAQGQGQLEAQGQGQLQAELQGQLQGQAELQAQDQGQDQGQGQGQAQAALQAQGQAQSSESYNGNLNGNGNGNGNLNGNGNGNLNGNGNANGNGNLNGNANGNLNANANFSDTTTTSTVVNKSIVDVNVDVGLEGYMPDDSDGIDLDLANSASVGDVMYAGHNLDYDPGNDLEFDDFFVGALDGAGNDTGMMVVGSNNLVDNDELQNPVLKNEAQFDVSTTSGTANAEEGIKLETDVAGGGGAGSEGHDSGGRFYKHKGDDKGDDDGAGGTASNLGQWGSGNGGDGSVAGTSLADAGGDLDVSAFNQQIVMGANVLGNTVDTTVVGGNMSLVYGMDDNDT